MKAQKKNVKTNAITHPTNPALLNCPVQSSPVKVLPSKISATYNQAVAEHTATPQQLIPLRGTPPHLRPRDKSRADAAQCGPRKAQK